VRDSVWSSARPCSTHSEQNTDRLSITGLIAGTLRANGPQRSSHLPMPNRLGTHAAAASTMRRLRP
jgi:hypothetical protein